MLELELKDAIAVELPDKVSVTLELELGDVVADTALLSVRVVLELCDIVAEMLVL
jgi:hypothetical protein